MAYTTLKALFTAIADAIRGKDGTTDAIIADDFPSRIEGIQTQDYTMEDALIGGAIKSYTNNRVDSIRSYAFYGRVSLQAVDLQNVVRVGIGSFSGCYALTEVIAPKLAVVDEDAFRGCTYLELLSSRVLRSIGVKAFDLCKSLYMVEMVGGGAISSKAFSSSNIERLVIRQESDELTALGNNDSFSDTPIASGTGYIYVPSAYIEAYKAAENWSAYANQFRALEDYTVDGTITGDLDPDKI